MKYILLVTIVLMLIAVFGCGNKVDVPANINTTISGTSYVNVTHSIAISADLLGVFKDACEAEANNLGLPVGSDISEQYIKACVAKKENDLLVALMGAINNIAPPANP